MADHFVTVQDDMALPPDVRVLDTHLPPASNAAALALKAPKDSPTFTGTVAGVSKTMVGLGNVDNTSDVDKPLSTLQAAALAGKADKSATGFSGSPAVVQDPVIAPSEVDARHLVAPAQKPQTTTLDVDLVSGLSRNLMQYTEDASSNRWGSTFTKYLTDTIVRDGITLTKVSSSNYYHVINTNFTGLGLTPFVVGKRYLGSMYVVNADAKERWFWMRDLTGSIGHGRKLLQPNKVTRVWQLYQASTTSNLVAIGNPSLGFASGTMGQAWATQGSGTDGAAGLSFYMGGLQIEQVADTALNGIAGIGDSTMQGASGNADSMAAFEWMGYLEGLLNAETYNRGIGGNKLVDMDARWATDITPLKVSCKYVIIQGGINDIGNGATLATVQNAVTSMTTKAKADGFIPVYLTCTPVQTIANNAGYETIRLQFNDWLKNTYGNVIDIAAVVADPYDPKYIRRTPGGATGWYGDGTHYTKAAKRAIAERIAAWPGWDLPVPTTYQKVAATAVTPAGGVVLVSANGTRYRLGVADDGALTTTSL